MNTQKQKTIEKSENTEQKILEAAQQEFIEKGFNGVRMQAIADRANVNKALQHYYFRTKDKLFKEALQDIMAHLWGKVQKEMATRNNDADLRTLIHSIVTTYITTFAEKPEVPRFFIREICNNSPTVNDCLRDIIKAMNVVPTTVFAIYNKELAKGTIKQIAVVHFMINLMGMCATTFIIKPVAEILSKDIKHDIVFDAQFYEQRIRTITEMACDGIFIKH